MNQSKSNFNASLLSYFLYVLGLLLIGWMIPSFDVRLENDSQAYLHLVQTYESIGNFYFPGYPLHTWFGIGYPLFIVGIKKIFGSLFFVILIQSLLGLLSIWYLKKIAQVLMLSSASYVPWLALANLGFMLYPHFFLTESLLLFLIILGWYFLCKARQSKEVADFAVAGGILGLSILIKPSVLFLIPVLGITLFFLSVEWKQVLTFLGFFAFFPLLLMQYHHKQFGHWYLKSVDKVNVYYFFLPHILAEVSGVAFEKEQELLQQLYPVQNYADPRAFDAVDPYFKEVLFKHPLVALKVWVTQMLKTLGGLYTNHLKVLLLPTMKGGECTFFGQEGNLMQKLYRYCTYKTDSWFLLFLACFEILYRIFLFFCAFYGLWVLFFERRWDLIFLLVIPALYFWATTGADGSGRLRLLIEPFWILIASVGIKTYKNSYNRP